MVNLPNLISFLRLPLALVFLQGDPLYRLLAILGALISDGLDGYFARRFKQVSKIGTLLDPLMDKFFVFLVLFIFIKEGRLDLFEASLLICRDFSVFLFGIYLALRGKLATYQFRAIWCGKITTVLQFFVLAGLTFGLLIPAYAYGVFILLGVLALGELYLSYKLSSAFSFNP